MHAHICPHVDGTHIQIHTEKSVRYERLQTICCSNNSLLPEAVCSSVLLLCTSLCKLISTLYFTASSSPLPLISPGTLPLPLSHRACPPFQPISQADGLSPQSSIMRSLEERGIVRREGQQDGGDEFRVDGLSDPLRQQTCGIVHPSHSPS